MRCSVPDSTSTSTETPPANGPSPEEIGKLVDLAVADKLKSLKAAPPVEGDPPAASSTPTDLSGQVAKAVAEAMAKRDTEDGLSYLEREVAAIKAKLGAAPSALKRGWGAFWVGL